MISALVPRRFFKLIAEQKANIALPNNQKALMLYASQHDGKYLPLCERIRIPPIRSHAGISPKWWAHVPTSASGQPRELTKLFAVVLAAGFVSFYLRISHSTLALVLACIGAAICATA